MAEFTFTENPTVGGDENTWGTILNTILTELKNAANTLESEKATETALNALATIVSGKADANHNHDTDYADLTEFQTAQAAITALENLTNYLQPNLTNVDVNLTISNTNNGINVLIETDPEIYARRYGVEVKRNGIVLFSVGGGTDTIFLNESFGFDDGDELQIRGQIVSGIAATKNSDWYTHTYQNQATPFTLEQFAQAAAQNTDFAQMVAAYYDALQG